MPAETLVVAVAGTRFGEPDIEAQELSNFDPEFAVGAADSDEALLELARNAVAILAGAPPRFNRHVLSQLGTCRTIVRYGVGIETIDLEAASERGILVANVPDYCTEEVATHTLALLLAAVRKLPQADRSVRTGHWQVAALRPLFSTEDQVLGIVGFGKIGQAVARKAQPFGFEILVHDPYADPDAVTALGVASVPLPALLRRADAITLNAPLTEDTFHLIDAAALAQMKPNAVLVNTGRGGLVDEAALGDALRNGRIAMAALDVLEKEPPPPDHPLRDLENALITPHTAWYTEQATKRMRRLASQEVARVLRGEWPLHLVNPAVKATVKTPGQPPAPSTAH